MPPNSDHTIVPTQAANTSSDSGRIHGARSLLSAKPSAPAPSTVAAVPAKACVSAASSTDAKYSMTGPRPSPISSAVANSQPIANVPTRKRAPANDETSSIPKPANEQRRAVPSEMSRPSNVPSVQKPSAMATRNMTCPSSWAVEISRGTARSL